MNIVAFPVNSTNIFPIANSHSGGQLLTEFNIRSRESVLTDPAVKYNIGPSFVHSQDDFEVGLVTDSDGTRTGTTSYIQIAPGRAVINGHYVESLAPIDIDLIGLNSKLVEQGEDTLTGELSIGLKMAYSTERTLAGSLQTELDDQGNPTDYYRGVHVVILPKSQMKTPKDSPVNQDEVNADIKLADFSFVGTSITGILNNEDKIKYISFDRISDFSENNSSNFVTRENLDDNKLYVIPGVKYPTLQDATGSLIVWEDPLPALRKGDPRVHCVKKAQFVTDNSGKVSLRLPHLQNAKNMTDTDGDLVYYKDAFIRVPTADFESGSSGVVDSSYTQSIKAIRDKITQFYGLPGNNMIGYLDALDDFSDLPDISYNPTIGSYVVVREDRTQPQIQGEVEIYPSTIYIVVPGFITSYAKINEPSSNMIGIRTFRISDWDGSIEDEDVYSVLNTPVRASDRTGSNDYITVISDEDTYYYKATSVGTVAFAEDPLYLTGGIQLATDSSVGGFLNVSEDDESFYGNGYVYVDSTGHLRLVDYDLLVTGVLAYQLGEDVTIPSGLDIAEVQSILDQYVNNRVAFTSAVTGSDNADTIVIELNLEDSDGVLEFGNIDSRFGTAVELKLIGSVTSNLTLNIRNCEKLKITKSDGCNPTIHLFDTCLCYDGNLLNYPLLFIDKGFTLWADSSTDNSVYVDGMTVMSKFDDMEMSESSDWWSSANVNDNQFAWCLRSITFSSTGKIIGVGLDVCCNSTTTDLSRKSMFISKFTLSNSAITFPQIRVVDPIVVSGSFVAGYLSGTSYYMTTVDFSASTETNTILFMCSTDEIDRLDGLQNMDSSSIANLVGTGFATGVVHYFAGGITNH